MKYLNFKVSHYKGISEEVTIDIAKRSIHPIIGVNESGKTSILEGILAFDKLNDETNNGNHLLNSENFYDPADERNATISAGIHVTKTEFKELIKPLFQLDENGHYIDDLMDSFESQLMELKKDIPDLNNLTITRDIKSLKYTSNLNLDDEIDDWICEKIFDRLPFILFFDDFRDVIPQFISIPENREDENQSIWIPYFEELLKQVNKSHDLYDLRNKQSNIRSSIIRAAQDILQEKLAKHWANFSVQGSTPLQIELDYHRSHDLEIKIVEKIKVGDRTEDRFFNIKDRSKGFYWYFNFIMKLEFNPQKRYSSDKETIYLLDEPGSYLHSTAQKKLSERLKSLSNKNTVIYCTHSPYLLNPKHIPINNILIASKKGKCDITLNGINSVKISRKNAAFQPILHALEISPNAIDYDKNNIVLTEGIYDYYLFEMLKSNKTLCFFPCNNASSIKHHISYMIFLGKKYSVIWDKDEDGQEEFKKAKKLFGEYEAKKWGFYEKGRSRKVILQNLIEGDDMKMIKKQLAIPRNTSFEKVILALYHSSKRKTIIKNISNKTKENFKTIEAGIKSRMK